MVRKIYKGNALYFKQLRTNWVKKSREFGCEGDLRLELEEGIFSCCESSALVSVEKLKGDRRLLHGLNPHAAGCMRFL